MGAPAIAKNLRRLRIHRQRPRGEQKARAVEQLHQRLRPLLQAWHGRQQLRPHARIEPCRNRRAALDMRQHRLDRGHQLRVGRGPHILPVHVAKLDKIKARGRAPYIGEIKRLNHFRRGKKLAVALAPAEPHQIVAQRLGQIPKRPVGINAQRAMALRQFGAIRAMDQRDMRHARCLPAKGLIDVCLARRVGQMVVAADDLRHAHVVVVHHNRQHVGRVAVGAQQHKIVEVFVGPGDAALHLVVNNSVALLRRAQPHHGLDAGRRLGGVAVTPAAIVAPRLALRPGGLAHLVKFLLRSIAEIGLAACHQRQRRLAVAVRPGKLEGRLAVPVKPKPAHAIQNSGDGRLGRTLAVGVLDAQQKRAAMLPGIEPVEQGRPRPADVEKAGGRGSKTGDDFGGHVLLGWRMR